MAQNVEIKAKIESLERIRELVQPYVTEDLGVQQQVDTYFQTPNGRLKVRQIDDRSPQLIWYQRADESAACISTYELLDVPDRLITVLDQAFGIRIQVRKIRQILMYHNVRIHLDEVERLGTFLEFEGVIGPGNEEKISRERVSFLCETLQLDTSHYLETSYSDLLENQSA